MLHNGELGFVLFVVCLAVCWIRRVSGLAGSRGLEESILYKVKFNSGGHLFKSEKCCSCP